MPGVTTHSHWQMLGLLPLTMCRTQLVLIHCGIIWRFHVKCAMLWPRQQLTMINCLFRERQSLLTAHVQVQLCCSELGCASDDACADARIVRCSHVGTVPCFGLADNSSTSSRTAQCSTAHMSLTRLVGERGLFDWLDRGCFCASCCTVVVRRLLQPVCTGCLLFRVKFMLQPVCTGCSLSK